jgi:hypothetical protein
MPQSFHSVRFTLTDDLGRPTQDPTQARHLAVAVETPGPGLKRITVVSLRDFFLFFPDPDVIGQVVGDLKRAFKKVQAQVDELKEKP